jgi:hypothetical protein
MALPEAPPDHLLNSAMMLALNPLPGRPDIKTPTVSDDGFRALAQALRELPGYLRPTDVDWPVKEAVASLLGAMSAQTPHTRAAIFKLILRRLPVSVGVWAYLTFVE